MFRQRSRTRLFRWLKKVTCYANRWWYAPFMALLSALDAYVLVIPNDPLVAAGAFSRPKKWLSLSVWMTVGSAVGAVSVAAIVSDESGWIFNHLVSRDLRRSRVWIDSLQLIRNHGLWGLSVVSLGPFPQHAAVIIAGLASMPLWQVWVAVVLGRGIKYCLIGYLGAKAPSVLRKWKLLPPEEECGEQNQGSEAA